MTAVYVYTYIVVYVIYWLHLLLTGSRHDTEAETTVDWTAGACSNLERVASKTTNRQKLPPLREAMRQ